MFTDMTMLIHMHSIMLLYKLYDKAIPEMSENLGVSSQFKHF